jgi:hypothetical protein
MALALDIVKDFTKEKTTIHRIMSFATTYNTDGTVAETAIRVGSYISDSAVAPVDTVLISVPSAPPVDGTKAKDWAEQNVVADAKFAGAVVVSDQVKP